MGTDEDKKELAYAASFFLVLVFQIILLLSVLAAIGYALFQVPDIIQFFIDLVGVRSHLLSLYVGT